MYHNREKELLLTLLSSMLGIEQISKESINSAFDTTYFHKLNPTKKEAEEISNKINKKLLDMELEAYTPAPKNFLK